VATHSNNISIYATYDIAAYSDARVKTNVQPITSALDKLMHISGYTFDRLESTKRSAGVLAQEVQQVLPEVVHEDSTGFLSVSYGNMAALFIEAIKELKQQKDDEISSLRKQIEALQV
jgi:6-pyruvoyl-tetrahydropterin synthase